MSISFGLQVDADPDPIWGQSRLCIGHWARAGTAAKNPRVSSPQGDCIQSDSKHHRGGSPPTIPIWGQSVAPPGSDSGHIAVEAMTTEAGTQQCRVLIEAKEQIEALLNSLSHLDHSEHLRQQLRAVHRELQDRHDLQAARRLNPVASKPLPPQFGWMEAWWYNEVS